MTEANTTTPAAPLDDHAVRALLQRAGRVTVVGLSTRPTRDSHRVATYLRDVAGYEVIGVNPGADHIDGFALGDLQGIEPLGIVDVFRASEHVSGVVDAVIERRPLAIWLQLGVRDEAAERRAREAGIPVVTGECLMVAHRRLLG